MVDIGPSLGEDFKNIKVLKRMLLITKDMKEFQQYSKGKTSLLFR